MALQLKTVAPDLTGGAVGATSTGYVIGISSQREGWRVDPGGVVEIAPGVHEVIPRRVNASGVVVGRIGDPDPRAFMFDGHLHDLQAMLGTSSGDARDISDGGIVVGGRAHVGEPRTAFRLDTTSGTLTPIPFAPGLGDEYVTSLAVAVTPDGRVAVGLASKAFSEAGRGFAYDHQTGETTDLGPHVFARAMNAHGLVAGVDPTPGDVVTFDLATQHIERHGRGLVEAINDDGVLIGSMSVNTPFFNSAPFFCRPGQALVDAAALVGAGPLRFASVSDITDDGRMVGTAVRVDPATGEPVTDASGQRQTVPVTASIN